MAFDPKLIPLFDGTNAGQSVVEWVEKAELVCCLSGVRNIECVVPMRLSGGAYAVYQQLSEEKRADFACIKDVLYTAFALSPVTAYKQFAVCRLHPGRNGGRLFGGATQACDSVRRYDGARSGLCIHCWVARACGESSLGHYPSRRFADIRNIGPCPSNIEGQSHGHRIGSRCSSTTGTSGEGSHSSKEMLCMSRT